MKLLREFVETEQKVDALPLMEALEESIRTLQKNTRGGKVRSGIKGAKDFFKANPGLTTAAAVLAVDAFATYQKNKKNTIRLHAKTSSERKMMTTIVDALTKDGKFKIDRVKFESGGKTWVMKRKWG